ncbi:MAG: hypothetical protein V3V30_07805 [Parvularculaceae bacterium]
MTRITSRIFILLTACAAVTGLAFANPLQSSPLKPVDVENFIETMEYISAHEEEFAKTDALRPKASMEVLSRVVNDKGEIVMFRSMLPDLAKNPVEQRQLKKITKDAGFASLDHWALTGDRVFVAYMGTQVTEKDRAQMRQSLAAMTPEMLAMMPASVKQQMQQATALSKAMSNVAPEDVEAIRPFVARLEAAMGE